MDEYEQYLADAEYEQYLQQAQQQSVANAMGRAGPTPQPAPTPTLPPFARDYSSQLGPDYNQSLGQNALKGITDLPGSVAHMAGDAYSFASHPIQSFQDAGIEGTARTVGPLAMGTAGALSLGGLGAAGGSFLGPVGTVIGGAIGGGLGLGAGLLGFDATTNFLTGTDKPVDEYLKDFAYNSTQGGVFEGGARGIGAAGRGVKKVAYDPFTPVGTELKVGNELLRQVPDLAQQIDAGYANSVDVPPTFLDKRSLGELTGNDALKAAQRTIERTGNEAYGRSAEARTARNDAQLKYLDAIEQSPATAADAQAAMQGSFDSRITAAQDAMNSAKGAVDTQLIDLAPKIDPMDAGATIRDMAQQSKDARRGIISNKFEAAGDGVVDITHVQTVAADKMPAYFREVGKQASPELQTLVEQLTKTAEASPSSILDLNGDPIVRPVTYSLKDIQALRSKALDIANGSDKATARVAGDIAAALLKSGEDAAASGRIPPEAVKSWKEGISLRKKLGTDYESTANPTKSVLAKQPHGDPRIEASRVPDKYFKPGTRGTKEAILNYKEVVGASEQALEPLYRYATDSFRDYAVKDGVVDSAKAKKWLDRHSTSLEQLPELKKQLSDVHGAQQFLNEKFGDLARTQAEMERGATKQFLQADPEKAIPLMLSGKDMVRRTIATVQYLKANDADAVAGLRRGVIEHLKSKAFKPDQMGGVEEALAGGTFKGKVLGGVLTNEYTRIKPALTRSKLFTESQIKALDYLYNDKNSQLSIDNAKAPGGSDTMQLSSTMATMFRAAGDSFIRNIPGGRTVSAILLPVLKAIPADAFKLKMEEALLNPRIARDLVQKATAKNLARTAMEIFKDEFTAAGVIRATTTAEVVASKPIKRQEQITSKTSFPKPELLLNPPSKRY